MKPRIGIYVFNGAEVVDQRRIVTAGGITSGMELGFYLLERHGYENTFVGEVARIMEHQRQWELMREDRLVAASV